ncbi:MAG: class I SAM-dependent methyltransferase, partial [Acidimicrobiales bacterium]
GVLLDASKSYMDKLHGERKTRMLSELTGTVVELGAGTGANFDYYADDVEIIAVEPNEHFHTRLRANAAKAGRTIEIRTLRGEALDLPDNVADAVVATLVLCSVDDPAQVLSEIKRILKPGGRFVFIDHVAAEPGTTRRKAQDRVERPHRWMFDGCYPNRDTEQWLSDAGFNLDDLERFEAGPKMFYIREHIAGSATLGQ